MRSLGIIAFIIIALLLMTPSARADASQVTLFFDDFVSSGFPYQWNSGNLVGINNATQIGSFLVTTIQRNAFIGTAYTIRMIANNTAPIVSAALNKTFVSLIFRMAPFNITNPIVLSAAGPGACSATCGIYPIVADMQFGLSSEAIHGGSGSVPRNAIYFELMEGTASLKTIDPNLVAQKTAIYLGMNGGPANGVSNFVTDLLVCCPGTNAMLYNGANSLFDLNALHTFSIQLNLNVTDATKQYVRFQIDNNGWVKFEQVACNCIGTGAVSTIYPFFDMTYLVGNAAGILSSPIMVSQSLASQIDWVYVTNFAPTSFPTDNPLLRSPGVPPAKLPQPGVTGTLTDFMQFEANSIAPGNIYGGGMMLMGIIGLVMFSVMGLAAKKAGSSLKTFGFAFTMTVLVLSFFGFITQILPIWIPVMTTIIAVGITFGVIKTGSSSGGLVPD